MAGCGGGSIGGAVPMLPLTTFSTHIKSSFSLIHTLFFLCCCDRLLQCKKTERDRKDEEEKEIEMDSEKEKEGGRERRERGAPQRIGLTLLMTSGSAALLNSLYYWQGGRENNTCRRGT